MRLRHKPAQHTVSQGRCQVALAGRHARRKQLLGEGASSFRREGANASALDCPLGNAQPELRCGRQTLQHVESVVRPSRTRARQKQYRCMWRLRSSRASPQSGLLPEVLRCQLLHAGYTALKGAAQGVWPPCGSSVATQSMRQPRIYSERDAKAPVHHAMCPRVTIQNAAGNCVVSRTQLDKVDHFEC